MQKKRVVPLGEHIIFATAPLLALLLHTEPDAKPKSETKGEFGATSANFVNSMVHF